MASMDRQQEFVLRTLEERDIRFVRLWFTDVSGYLKAVAVAPAEIEAAFASARRSTCRGSAHAGEPSGSVMSQNIRAVSLGCPLADGITWNVPGSGLASMSDS